MVDGVLGVGFIGNHVIKIASSAPDIAMGGRTETRGSNNKAGNNRGAANRRAMGRRDKLGNYLVKELIESGSTSNVFYGVDLRSKKHVAVKVISRSKYVGRENKEVRENRILREALLSYLLDHPHIVKLRDFFFTDENFYLIFDYVKGVQLLKHIIRHRKLREDMSRKYFRQIVSAVEYCHSNSVVHRDMKIENVLIDSNDNALLIDFGLSNFYDAEGFLGTFCGSLYFAAPELLSGKPYRGPEIDVWSLGVVLYVMVCGRVPFDDKNTQSLYQKILKAEVSVPEVTPELELLIKEMLNPDPKTRISIEQIMEHPWTTCGGKFCLPSRPFVNTEVRDDEALEYVVNLFGAQFEDAKAVLGDAQSRPPVASLCHLIRRKAVLNPLSASGDRAVSIMEFIEDRRVIARTTFFRCWRGMGVEEGALTQAIECVFKALGMAFCIENGKYECCVDGRLRFRLSVIKNVFNLHYGVRFKRVSGPKKLMKATAALINRELKNQIFN